MATATTDAFSRARRHGIDGRPREHVVVSNYGWYLFNRFPIVCGNADPNATFPWVFFRDDVTSDIVHGRLTSYAAAKGANVADLNLFFTENVLLEVPGTSFPIPMPYVLCYRERLVSGILMEQAKALPAPEPVAHASTKATPAKRDMQKLLERIPDGGVK